MPRLWPEQNTIGTFSRQAQDRLREQTGFRAQNDGLCNEKNGNRRFSGALANKSPGKALGNSDFNVTLHHATKERTL